MGHEFIIDVSEFKNDMENDIAKRLLIVVSTPHVLPRQGVLMFEPTERNLKKNRDDSLML